jgi:hypothetical protein
MIRQGYEVLPLVRDNYQAAQEQFVRMGSVMRRSSDAGERANATLYYIIADGFSKMFLDITFQPEHFYNIEEEHGKLKSDPLIYDLEFYFSELDNVFLQQLRMDRIEGSQVARYEASKQSYQNPAIVPHKFKGNGIELGAWLDGSDLPQMTLLKSGWSPSPTPQAPANPKAPQPASSSLPRWKDLD